MLDRLRFQEIEKAIFRVREEGKYGDKYLLKGEPFMIIDNASLSNFTVGQRDKNIIGRSTEAATSTVRNITFTLMNGSMMLNLFNSIFGRTKHNQNTTVSITDSILINDSNSFELPSEPIGEVLLYLTDDYGNLTRINKNQYAIDGKKITFIKNISQLITYVYEEALEVSSSTSIRQLGTEVIMSLELQCKAMDIQSEEKMDIIIRFDKVSVGTNFYISFNNSERASGSAVYVQVLADDNQNDVNKEIFTIEVV
mgnify:CR=1 FL=1